MEELSFSLVSLKTLLFSDITTYLLKKANYRAQCDKHQDSLTTSVRNDCLHTKFGYAKIANDLNSFQETNS